MKSVSKIFIVASLIALAGNASPPASDVSNLRWRARFCVNIVVNPCCYTVQSMKYLFRKYISFLTRHLLSCPRIFPFVRLKKWSACMSWENIYEKHLASTTLSQDMLQQLLSSIWWCLSNPFKAARRAAETAMRRKVRLLLLLWWPYHALLMHFNAEALWRVRRE